MLCFFERESHLDEIALGMRRDRVCPRLGIGILSSFLAIVRLILEDVTAATDSILTFSFVADVPLSLFLT